MSIRTFAVCSHVSWAQVSGLCLELTAVKKEICTLPSMSHDLYFIHRTLEYRSYRQLPVTDGPLETKTRYASPIEAVHVRPPEALRSS